VEPALWYYLEGSRPQGPVAAAELAQRLARGELAPSTPVAQAGWPEWQPAERALWPDPAAAPLPPPPQPPALRAAAPAASQAVQLRAVGGPDAGKAFWIGAAEVSLGSASGLVSGVELVAALAAGKVRVRALAGGAIELDGNALPEAQVGPGQRFRVGATVWQVGERAVGLGDLAQKLGDRLSRLASVEKLEGFSLQEMFSEVFAKRSSDELDAYLVVGTARTTPPIEEVTTGWPKPWLFFRVFAFLAIVYFGFYAAVQQFLNPRLLPGLIMMGSLAVPFATLILFFELNTPRNVSFRQVLTLFCLGGVVSLFVSLIGFSVADLSWLGASSAGIVEEVGKLATVVLIARGARYRYILNGLLFGAAVGAGFAVFESAGYALNDALLATGSLGDTTNLILRRALLSPFGHVAWTAIAAGALWRVKGERPFSPAMLADPSFLRAFLIPVGLHMIWNSPLPSPFFVKHLLLGVVGWFVLFGFVQQGLREVKGLQRETTRRQLESTRTLTASLGLLAK
jgi:RsiW-degrading membrane proteinase PrsW (M82 family)